MSVKELGETIKKLRVDSSLTIVDLSNMSGVSNPYISQIENGKFMPSLEVLDKLSKTLGVPLWYFIEVAGFELGDNAATTANENLRRKLRKIEQIIKEENKNE